MTLHQAKLALPDALSFGRSTFQRHQLSRVRLGAVPRQERPNAQLTALSQHPGRDSRSRLRYVTPVSLLEKIADNRHERVGRTGRKQILASNGKHQKALGRKLSKAIKVEELVSVIVDAHG